jgi:hypothetical protein
VFEFIRNPGLPAGVVLQPTLQPMNTNQIMTATFQLGNSSGVRKRVTVILHDNDFSDLSACTFWLAPGQPLSSYAMQTYATEAWTNATLSVYGATPGPDQWIRLDNATFTRTPSSPISGTNCLEPGASPVNVPAGTPASVMFVQSAGDPVGSAVRDAAEGRSGPGVEAIVDLRQAIDAGLSVRTWLLGDADAVGEVQVSVDGANWVTVGVARASDSWETIDIDLGEFAGQVLHVRFVITGRDARDRQAAIWRIGDLAVR